MGAIVQMLRVVVVGVALACMGVVLLWRPPGTTQRRVERALLAGMLLLHVVILACRAYLVGFFPFSSIQDVLVLLSLLVLGIYWITGLRLAGPLVGAGVYVCSAVVVAISLFGTPQTQTAPELRSALLPVHVVGAIAAYGCFTFNFLLSMYSLARPRAVREDSEGEFTKVVTLRRRFALTGWVLYAVFVMGGGMLWAKLAWGRYWGWDPKETLSLAAFCVYSLYVYFEMIIRPKSRVFLALLAAFAYLTLVLTFVFGMRLAGLHGHA